LALRVSPQQQLADRRWWARWEVLVVPVVVFAVWLTVLVGWDLPRIILPAPTGVVEAFVENWQTLLSAGLVTLWETAAGFVAGLTLGLALAVIVFTSPFLKETLYPLLFGFRIVPKVAFVPLFMVWFGTGLVMKSAITAMAVFFIFLVQALLGFASAEPELIELARSLRMSKWAILWRLRFPAALPSLMVGLKLGLTYALTMVIVSEMVVATRGLGAVVVESSARLRTAEVIAVILTVSVAGVSLYALGNRVDKRLTRWYYE